VRWLPPVFRQRRRRCADEENQVEGDGFAPTLLARSATPQWKHPIADWQNVSDANTEASTSLG